jgi:hypothetical protein
MDVKTLTTFNTEKADITLGIAVDWKSVVIIGVVFMVALVGALFIYSLINNRNNG